MATVQLSDAVVYDVYMSYTAINNMETTRLLDSGVFFTDPTLNQLAGQNGKFASMPFWKDLDATIEQNYSNDDPADMAVPNKLGSGEMMSRRSFVNQGYSTMDLVAELAGSNPMQRIRDRFGVYWGRRKQRRMIAIANGIVAWDKARGASADMGLDISAGVGAAAVFNSDAVIDANYTMGEYVGGLGIAVLHPKIEARAKKDDQIDFIPDSSGNLTIPTYKGMRVITTKQGTEVSAGVYRSHFFGTGAFGFGNTPGGFIGAGMGVPVTPVEVDRTPRAGNGGGMEEIWERETWLMHPFGFTWIEGTLVEFSPTDADLALAAHWDRVVERENIPYAYLDARADAA